MTRELILSIEQIRWLRASDRIEHPDWDKIEHGFFGRTPRLRKLPDTLKRCRQVHGTTIVNEQSFEQSAPPEADGIYKLASECSIGVQTADCLPILFASRSGPFRAAVHAGWRGLTEGVLVETMALHSRLGAPEDLMVGIGPAISLGKFEVGPEVLQAMKKASMGLTGMQFALVISKGVGDRWHVDLSAAAALQLANLNVPSSQIYTMRSCSFSESERWYSYRREGKGCGMNISWIS